jgi:hypothetical protein
MKDFSLAMSVGGKIKNDRFLKEKLSRGEKIKNNMIDQQLD